MTPLLTDDELPKPRYYVVNGYLYTSRGAAENCARMISPTEGESLPVDALYTAEQMRARDRAVEARVRETPLFAAPPPSAPEPSEAQIAAANEALYRVLFSIEAGAHKTVLELRRAAMLEALRAAAAARNSK